ncbi:MAG: biotin/lipoyl-binding protein, partial [Pseudomonadales bacterium]|nr:biotin/lipoyl-binding protein [Pseudomonadales bacterium]
MKQLENLKELYQRLPKPATIAIPIIVILVVVLLPFTVPTSRQVTIEGVVEIHTRPYFSEVSGRIVEMPISLGQRVEKGDTIAVFENVALQNQIDSLGNSLEHAKLSLAQLQSGTGIARQIASNEVEVTQRQMFT